MIQETETARVYADAMRNSSRQLARSGLASRHIHLASSALSALAELLETAHPPISIEQQTALFDLVTAGLAAQLGAVSPGGAGAEGAAEEGQC